MNTNFEFLTETQLKEKAPSIFTTTPLDTLSEYYTHIPTKILIEDMALLNWHPVKAFQVKTKKKGNHQKHTVSFRNPDVFITGEDKDDVWPEILLTNSHDGSSCFNFQVGLFRMICENGLVVSEKLFENIKIIHMGYEFEVLKEKITNIIQKLPLAIESMNKMKELELNEKQMIDLAQKMIKTRFPDKKVSIDIEEFMIPVRDEDNKLDLWTNFNKFQEKLINGNFVYRNEKGKFRKARPIKSFIKDVQLNSELFDVALEFVS